MRQLRHGIKSILRRPVKTTMLFMIFLVVFNLVFTGVIVQNSIKSSKNYIRNKIGGVVEYQIDYNNFYLDKKDGDIPDDVELPPISIDKVLEIGESNYVLKTYYTTTAFWETSIESVSDGDGPIFIESAKLGIMPTSYIQLYGINQSDSVGMNIGKETIIEGNLFTKDELDSSARVAMISNELASVNNLVVGDEIEFTIRKWKNGNEETIIERFVISGIYETTSNDKNTIYTPYNTITSIEERDTSYFTGQAYFLIEDPLNINSFKAEVNDSLPDYHMLYSNDSEYEKLTAPLDLVSLISNLLTWVVLAAGILIIASIVTIFVRDRKFEIGLLLSSGESKLKIVTQFVFEISLIAIITFGVSTLTSSLISNNVSGWIAETQLVSNEPDNPWGDWSNPLYGDIDMEEIQSEFDSSIDVTTLINMFSINLGLIMISSIVPLTAIMSFKPRRILQD